MRLNGRQLQQIQEALLSAFPSRDHLRMMVRFKLNKKLDEIADGENLRIVVFNLLDWAESNGRMSELVTGALEEIPMNEELFRIAEDFLEWQEEYIKNRGQPSSGEILPEDSEQVISLIRRRQIEGKLGPGLDLAYKLQLRQPEILGLQRLINELEDEMKQSYVNRFGLIALEFQRSASFDELAMDSPLRSAYMQVIETLSTRIKSVFDWVTIPEGEFLMGSDKKQDPDVLGIETPQHKLTLPEYRIARVPVTNAQYKLFVDATGHRVPSHWENGEIPQGKDTHPVVNVFWGDAMAFCDWAGARLPTEAEWEKAARGTDGRIWPWGNNEPTEKLCNFRNSDTTPVGSYLDGASPYGCLDMASNVWEWTSSKWKDYPYDAADGRESPDAERRRVLRGGSFDYNEDYLRCAARFRGNPNYIYDNYGFRVCAAPITPDR